MASKNRMVLLDDWVLTKVYGDNLEKVTKGGIVLPDTIQKDRADKAIVLEIAENVKNIKVGQKIAFLRYGPVEIKIDDQDFLMIRERDVIGIIP